MFLAGALKEVLMGWRVVCGVGGGLCGGACAVGGLGVF